MELQSFREPLEALLERLPISILVNFARKYRKDFSLKIHLPREKLLSQILQKVPENILIQELYQPYGWAGNVTIHLFQIVGSNLNLITDENQLKNILRGVNFEKELTELPELVDITLSGDEVRVRHNFLGKPIIYQDPETRKLKSVKPLETAFSVIHLPNGLTEVRVYERVHALNVMKKIKQYFGGNYEKLSFTREHLSQWIEWAVKLRNARFKPTGPISTLYMGAKEWYDLRTIKEFRELWEKGERIEGIYIKFETSSKRELGFGINVMGKIMFKTFASEKEIKIVVEKGREILGL
jgi:hypothetical protein